MLEFDNPFLPGSAATETKAPSLPSAAAVYSARRPSDQSNVAGHAAPAATSPSARPLMYAAGRRERRAGRSGFSIDPARLEAYRRRSAGCRGSTDKADDDRRKAQNTLDAQKYQARRFIDNRQAVPAALVARIKELQTELDAADANYAAVSDEIQGILSIADRIEKYADEYKAEDVAARRQEIEERALREYQKSRGLQLDGDDE